MTANNNNNITTSRAINIIFRIKCKYSYKCIHWYVIYKQTINLWALQVCTYLSTYPCVNIINFAKAVENNRRLVFDIPLLVAAAVVVVAVVAVLAVFRRCGFSLLTSSPLIDSSLYVVYVWQASKTDFLYFCLFF